jgi:dTDP-4-dehydrorhamnose reductase
VKRIFVTGAGGFVGSNLVHVFADRHGAEVIAPSHETVDLTDRPLLHRCVAATRPDAIVHAAIWNDPTMLSSDRRRAWKEYVGATRSVVDAANDVDARVVLISTDWVFDGTQGPANETEPPNPINPYGFLKAASELVVTQRAARGTVARIAGVQGVHRARPETPRHQDAGFGYLVASLVDALRAGRRFTVWDGDGLNQLATPTLATDAAELIWLALEREVSGILHCCGGEHADRIQLARRAVAAFGLSEDLLDVGPAPAEALAGGAIPRDTRLDAAITAQRLGAELPDLDTTLARLRQEMETSAWDPGLQPLS